jgi:UDP-GlcNAc:undecaprenyl-phosphate GlcNAc-1-phosphate transferase
MPFPLNIYLLAAAAAWATTLVTLPLWRAWSRRIGLLDEPGHRKTHEAAVPLAGGLAILTGLLLPLCVAWLARRLDWFEAPTNERITYGFEKRTAQLIALLGGAFGMTFLGWLDDRFELRPRTKLPVNSQLPCSWPP